MFDAQNFSGQTCCSQCWEGWALLTPTIQRCQLHICPYKSYHGHNYNHHLKRVQAHLHRTTRHPPTQWPSSWRGRRSSPSRPPSPSSWTRLLRRSRKSTSFNRSRSLSGCSRSQLLPPSLPSCSRSSSFWRSLASHSPPTTTLISPPTVKFKFKEMIFSFFGGDDPFS